MCRHNKCNYTWKVSPNHFLNNKTRCPYCRTSKGETKIIKWLDKNNIKYEQQYSFKNLKLHKYGILKFDFMIPNTNNNIFCLIEYDGIQHYKKHLFYNKEKDFKLIQKRDQLKNKYCKNNNIYLLRIPYTEYNNINKILQKEIGNYL